MSASSSESQTEFSSVLDEWNRDHNNNTGQLPRLKRLAELVEKETEAYFKMDPDPFDDRHPGKTNPTCALGHLMKTLFKNEDFMNELVGSYLMNPSENNQDLHTAACRLLLDVMPGMEASVVFQDTEGLVDRLFGWAENGPEPLRSYATGLLAGAMEIQDVASANKEKNYAMVPLMLKRLHELRKKQVQEESENVHPSVGDRPFSMFGEVSPTKGTPSNESISHTNSAADKSSEEVEKEKRDERRRKMKRALSPSYYSEDLYRLTSTQKRARYQAFGNPDLECSNSSWAELEPYVIGSYSMSPLTAGMKQRMILQYLIPMGEYQELLGAAFEHNALNLILYYINLKENKDVRLAFEALKYLATLLCHKKFAIEFLSVGGVGKLLEVYRPSIAATGVSLCLYYLSYFEDAMVCLLPEHILSDLVGYVMWLMECSHDSSRCHAAMFFTQAFPFRVIMELFDQKDGLRRLFNVISTLEILNVEDEVDIMNEGHIFTMRQTARHVCSALKRYFEAHLAVKADEIRRSHLRNDGSSSLQETPAYKPLKLTPEVIQDNMELLMELLPLRTHWVPEATFHRLGGIQLLIQLVAMAPDWNNSPGKPETIKSALDVISLCMVTPKSQLLLLDSISLPDNMSTPAIRQLLLGLDPASLHNNKITPAVSVIIGLAEGEILADPEVQKSALGVLVNCVCGPIERLGGGVGRFMGAGSKKKVNWKIGEDTMSRMWNGVRTNNGIMVLLKLLTIKTPITDADAIRALACRALVGLSRSETVRQIISKLPLFQNGTLQSLMKEPVLQDKRQEHIKFCRYASDLLERVSGKRSNTLDASLEDIRKADIVAQTKIIFHERELLQLIHDHLLAKGFLDAASSLQKQASLPHCSTPPLVIPTSTHIFSSPSTPRLSRQLSQTHSAHSLGSTTPTASSHSLTSIRDSPPTAPTPTTSSPGPIRFSLTRQPPTPSTSAASASTHRIAKTSKFLREKDSQTPSSVRLKTSSKTGGEYDISLNKIVTEYLRKQHALCRNPVVTCPPMSLFIPHRCPEPKGRTSAPPCITSRLRKREICPRFGGMDGARCNRKYIYSRFRPVRTYRDGDEDGFACCAFSSDEKYLLLGTFSGDVKLSSKLTGEQVDTLTCHTSPIIHLEPSRDGKLLLTSTWGTMQDSSLWGFGESLENKFTFDDHYAEFSNVLQERIIGTKDETAHIYDTLTGQNVVTLFDADKANNYKANAATFSPTDDLVLNDGVLWDVRTSRTIHKFDKFNSYISGVFHPMGLEIIINSEVWDIRTFHLLNTVPALDQCQIKFNHSGDVIYATRVDEDPDNPEDRYRTPYGSTLRTFDATDYSSIGTMDLKTKSIFDLCTDKSDCYLAVVENQQFSEVTGEESVCRLYEMGKLRDEEDDQQEEEEEEEEEEDGGDDDDDDDDDDDEDLNIDLGDLGSDLDLDDLIDDEEENEEAEEAEPEEYSIASDDDDDDDNDGDVDIDDDALFELV
ncbi:DDB1- and CUL4-associated factor 1-like isoform X2 [Haliotis rufescens]|uniref:DDB1- and CUL4-associated factor 1-like isoform X2 n=1 Tax=Haliotis rufescens TaxID=6454 RepID=UPI001EAFEB60|nr:DDB1- and CUL4-associated factor 1-like isoform X2 [Haliotis rufescens]